MKIAIVGAGNIGSSIVQCLAPKGCIISISNPSPQKLESLKGRFPSLETTTDNRVAVRDADVIFLAVKPYLVESILSELAPSLKSNQIIVSCAAGIGVEKLAAWTESCGSPVFHVIPNTAISKGESMSFYCSHRAESSDEAAVESLLGMMGKTLKVNGKEMGAFMALSSCGIAYALRYIHAAMSGAVELGIRPAAAESVICQTLKGAVALLEDGAHPEVEIDKVTTPGGLTIKGLNAMEAHGFTSSVIEGLKASKV